MFLFSFNFFVVFLMGYRPFSAFFCFVLFILSVLFYCFILLFFFLLMYYCLTWVTSVFFLSLLYFMHYLILLLFFMFILPFCPPVLGFRFPYLALLHPCLPVIVFLFGLSPFFSHLLSFLTPSPCVASLIMSFVYTFFFIIALPQLFPFFFFPFLFNFFFTVLAIINISYPQQFSYFYVFPYFPSPIISCLQLYF